MPREIRFQFPLPNGLHARPASHLQAVGNRFASAIQLLNQRTGRAANAKSVLSLVSADVAKNDPCVLSISGPDEEQAERELNRFLRDELPICDEPLGQTRSMQQEMPLPRSLQAAGLQEFLRGDAASGGIGWGKVVLLNGLSLADGDAEPQATNAQHEYAQFEAARQAIRGNLEDRIAASSNPHEAGVLRAHLAILNDIALTEKVAELVDREGYSAAKSVRIAADHFISTLRSSTSHYLRERVLDLQDVAGQLLDLIARRNGKSSTTGNGNGHGTPMAVQLEQPSICIANHLTPGQFLALDRRLLKGLVLREAGATSHTVILARSMSVPTLIGVPEVSSRLQAGQEIIMDANLGILIPEVTEPLRRYYQLETRKLEAMDERLASARDLPAVTTDGLDLEVGANVGSAEEVAVAMQSGADGIGLFRSEMLFLDRESPPSEEEQFDIYRRAAIAARGQPVMIRLLDVGGDKPVPYLHLPAEPNPFLGYRGVRIYAEHGSLIRSQIRAVLRAATWGDVRILVPMVCCVEEVRAVKRVVDQIAQELATAESKESSKRAVPVGAMLEVPSCAFAMEELCREADFFSVGSNDLAQYFLAADRDNAKVASLYSWAHPPFLRMLQKMVDAAHEQGKWIGLCGEMAENAAALPLLLAMGFDEISLPSGRIPAVRRAVCATEFARCTQLLEEVLACETRGEVETLLEEYTPAGQALPLLSPDLLLQSHATTKAEVIKEMTDMLWLAGRADQPHLVEEAVWQREDTYSTGFGYGFALPHCRSDQVVVNSIVVAKLAEPVVWGSTDKRPVDVVILVAMRAADYEKSHMRIFAQLSRLVMRDEFREKVRELNDPRRLLAFLRQSLGVAELATVGG